MNAQGLKLPSLFASMGLSSEYLYVGGLIIALVLLVFFCKARGLHRKVRRQKQLRKALTSFHITHDYTRSDGSLERYLYSPENTRRLFELQNEIIKYGHGTSRWLYFMPERRLFFILELVAVEARGKSHFIHTVHPISLYRAKRLLTRYPKLYRLLFREAIPA